jgi:hypothetical protein
MDETGIISVRVGSLYHNKSDLKISSKLLTLNID